MKFVSYLNEETKKKVIRVEQKGERLYSVLFDNDTRESAGSVKEIETILQKYNTDQKDVKIKLKYDADQKVRVITLYDFIKDYNSKADNIKELILKNCKPFLNEIKGGKLLIRGVKKIFNDIAKISPRKDRTPLSSNEQISNAVDEALYKKFRWKPRSEGVFAEIDNGNSYSIYGIKYLFFPIGNYEYIWSPKYIDLYLVMSHKGYKLSTDYLINVWFRNITEGETNDMKKLTNGFDVKEVAGIYNNEPSMEELLKVGADYIADKYINNNINKSITKYNHVHEISFKCDSYYLVDMKYQDILMELIK